MAINIFVRAVGLITLGSVKWIISICTIGCIALTCSNAYCAVATIGSSQTLDYGTSATVSWNANGDTGCSLYDNSGYIINDMNTVRSIAGFNGDWNSGSITRDFTDSSFFIYGCNTSGWLPAVNVNVKTCANVPTLAQKWGGMTYVNWNFKTSDIHSLKFDVDIDNNPGNQSDLYLQLYDASIDGSGQYFGIQTTGTVLFSKFGTANPNDASVPAGSTLAIDGNPFNGEGSTYISIRRGFGALPAGHYTVRMSRNNYDGTGDWFGYFVTFPGQAETYVGSIRFPRSNAAVAASFSDGGGTWTEAWDNNGASLFPVSLWHVHTAVIANGNILPYSAVSAYSSMPNSDISAESDGGLVDLILGGCTTRTHPAGTLWTGVRNFSNSLAITGVQKAINSFLGL